MSAKLFAPHMFRQGGSLMHIFLAKGGRKGYDSRDMLLRATVRKTL